MKIWDCTMTKDINKTPIIFLLGPTASGKTSLAIRLAQELDTEIISADSRYLYRELNIGTAKPTEAELKMVKHHLIDVTSVSEIWSLGEYLKAIKEPINNLHSKGKIPVLVGGTGQYYRAIAQGWQVPKLPPNPALRTAIENWGNDIGFDALHQKLSYIDPNAAKNIDHRNHRRTVRAWEVILATGELFSEQRQKGETPYKTLSIGIEWDRPILYERIDKRIDQMFKDGLIEEVKDLMNKGLTDAVKKIGVIGYAETIAYLENEISFDDCIMLIKRHTRQFVRRQANWFKPGDPNIHWFKATDPAYYEKILGLIDAFMVSANQ